ncbi:MAG: phosphoadenosine phosphosulfate reductase family protein [Rhizobiales bacterium]|nr:phosphoadenosine phosphosulfate reductase family protein [Hyphomicrobiales bacterium]
MNAVVPVQSRSPAAVLARPLVRIVIVGHVDHGKSTLIGRLLHETDSLPTGKLEQLQAMSARRGMPFEWSFVLDALQSERDQNITIDTSQIRFRTHARDFVLIDAPGHAEFLRNMITGAAQADAAVLVVDAIEGVRDQTRRHGYLLQLLGIRQVVVVINKMDRIAYDATRFREIETDITDYLRSLGLPPLEVIPVSAREGVGITEHTYTSEWYRPTLVEALDKLSPAQPALELPLRFPIQAIYKFDDRRILAGRVESGRITAGDELILQPSGARTRVRSIEAWPVPRASGDPAYAAAGQSIGITLEDPLFIERGAIASSAAAPAQSGTRLRARVFWLDSSPLETGVRLDVGLATGTAQGVVTTILSAVDPGSLAAADRRSIGCNHVGEIEIALDKPLAGDAYDANPATGRAVLEVNGRIAGGGLVLEIDAAAQPISAPASPEGIDAGTLRAKAAALGEAMRALSPVERIARLRHDIDGKIVFTTSFGLEDQIILHGIAESGFDIDLVTLDTGRLFPETYELWAKTEQRYGRRIRAIAPRHDQVEQLVARQGINGFYQSKATRESCCNVRKVEPLGRALSGAQG